ncbi:MAG: competence/damage-inducible protein A [Lutibacter sp.]
MQAEIITIGDEILIGQITDTNSKWIAEALNKIGVSVYQITSIQDERLHILKALREAQENAAIVIVTGGLGPTKDDITKQTITDYFNDHLILNEKIVAHIKKMFAKINYPFTEVNKNQALLPSKCVPLMNKLGTAPGMWFSSSNKVVVFLPGVPYEMKGLMTNEVLPRLRNTYQLRTIVHQTVQTYGLGESVLADKIADWENNLPEFIKLAYLPSFGRVRLRLSAKGNGNNELKKVISDEIDKLYEIIPDAIVGIEDSEPIEVAIGKLLQQKEATLSTAESCTGGNIAHKITSVPGSSAYFIGSVVSYHVAVKINELGISKDLIDNYSVVSAEVATEMAKSIQKKFKTNYAIATTGNAGPTTDKTDKTVGVVFIAIATPTSCITKEFYFGKPREKVIERASNKALELLRVEILKNA